MRDMNIKIRCSADEKKKLKENAKKHGTSMSQYLLELGLEGKEPSKKKDRDRIRACVQMQQAINEYKSWWQGYTHISGYSAIEMLADLERGLSIIWPS